MAYKISITFTCFYLIGNIVRGESPTSTIATLAETMPNPLDQVPDILIEPIGVFQYILINVTLEKDPDGNAPYKIIVRGKKYAKNHAEIFEEECAKLHKLGLKGECLGGGRIKHDVRTNAILIFGYSQEFNRPNHDYTRYLLKKVYKNDDIRFSNDGYYEKSL